MFKYSCLFFFAVDATKGSSDLCCLKTLEAPYILYVGGFHDYGITMFIMIMVKMEIMMIIMLMVKMVLTDDDVYHLGGDLPGHLA